MQNEIYFLDIFSLKNWKHWSGFSKGYKIYAASKTGDQNNTLYFFQICRKSLGSNNFQTFSWFWKRNRYKEWKNLSTCVLFKNHWWSYNATTGSFSSDVRVAMGERSMFIIQTAEIVLLQNHLWEFSRLSETLKTSFINLFVLIKSIPLGWLFLTPTMLAETGYQTGKVRPKAPSWRLSLLLGFLL